MALVDKFKEFVEKTTQSDFAQSPAFNSQAKEDALKGAKELGTSFAELAKKAYNNKLVQSVANQTGLSWNTSVSALGGGGGLMDAWDPLFSGKTSESGAPDAETGKTSKGPGATVTPLGADDPDPVLGGAPSPGGR